MASKVTVHIDDAGRHFLRLYIKTSMTETLSFDSGHGYSKREADFRAIAVSAEIGCGRDDLPTHPYTEAVPIL